jgi:hypothetical protein
MKASVRTYLFTNHVHRVLDAAVGNNGDDRGVSDAQVADAVDAELLVDDALVDVLGETGGSAGV